MAQGSSPSFAVLFDVDGVLVYPPLRFRDYLERHHGITAVMTAPFFRGRFQACLTGHAHLQDELGVYLDQWKWPGTVGAFIETWLKEDDARDAAILDLVATLRSRGFKCHVASVQERNRAAYLRETMGFESAFDQTFFSCDLGAAKPEPEFYLKIQERLGKPPHELLLVDDSLACFDAALHARWQAFQYSGPVDLARLAARIAESGGR
jgi:putative hydrolase of the HAD superfamily